MIKRLLVIALMLFIAAGCAKPAKKPEAGLHKMPEKKAAADKKEQPPLEVKETLAEAEIAKIEKAEIPEAYKEEKEITFSDVRYDYDRYEIRAEDLPVLKELSDWLLGARSKRLLIEGHCDERGTSEYNLALGDRRAVSVRNYLIALGVPPSKILTVSFGSEKPLCTEHEESCWSKNRRAHFVIIED